MSLATSALLAADPDLAALERYRERLPDVFSDGLEETSPGSDVLEPLASDDLELLAALRELDAAEWGRAP